MAKNIQGVDLSTGKLYIPLTLASLSGPNGFGETFGIQYSTLGLPPLIRTWNQDAPTGTLGLGWSLTTPSITRLGNGSIYDTFLLNGQKLIMTSYVSDGEGGYNLTFVTAVNSLLQINYQTTAEIWTIVDSDGITYTYGSDTTDHTQYGVNWQSMNGQGPNLWVGTSIQSDSSNQSQYVRIWNLASKTNIYGQQVNYTYSKSSLNVGKNSQGLMYDVSSYLVSINVVGGQSLQLFYQEKGTWEYPPLRSNYETDGTITNAYQDRIETQYLSSAQLYDELGQLQNIITFGYGFLWDNFSFSASTDNTFNSSMMNKRLLTSITVTTPDGYEVTPPHTFDYWGYGNTTAENNNDGFQAYFNSTDFNIMTMLNGALDGSGFATGYTLEPYQDASGNIYNQLFGHLKNIQSPEGALTWYSYAEVSQNYSEIGSDFDTQWQNQLDLTQITPPTTSGITWTCPRPFWGPDGYLVIRWYSENKYNDNYQMCIVVYEWLGKWVSVLPSSSETFAIYDWEANPIEDYQVITTGTGFFCVLITSSSSDFQGFVKIFNRNPNLPGQWQSNSYSYNINAGEYLTKLPDNESDMSNRVEVTIGNNIISILDKVALNLYAFGWNGQSWDVTTVDNTTLSSSTSSSQQYNSASTILGNSIFIIVSSFLSSENATYFIFNYNPVNVSNPWVQFSGIFNDVIFLTEGYQTVLYLQATPANGYIVVNALINNYGDINNSFSMPLIVSWDDNFDLTYQKIEQNGNWSFQLTDTENLFFPWIGQGNFSSVADNLYYTASDEKSVFRYIASPDASEDTYGNVGWESQQLTSNKSNDTFWGNLALPDMTIAAQGTTDITFTFYQYDPTSQTWIQADDIGTTLGSTTDTDEIIAIVCFSIQIAGLVLIFLAPLGSVFAGLGQVLNILTMPLASLASIIVGTASASIFTEATAEAVSGIFDFLAQQAEGIGQNFLVNYLIKRSMDNYSNGGIGSFILCGQSYTTPSLFYNQWFSNSAPGIYSSYQWNSINLPAPSNVLYLNCPPIDGPSETWNVGLTSSTFSVGNYCIPYGYIEILDNTGSYYYMCSDQVVFLNNGQVIQATNMPLTSIPDQYTDTYSDDNDQFPVYLASTNEQVTSISYQIDSYCETEDDYGSPLLTAPWGGVLGFLGTFYKSWDDYDYYQENIDQALEFGLFMAKDEALEGQVKDYIINKVAVADGYQTNNTFFQFMPQLAAYDRTMNTARYNQVHVAQGADTYINSAEQFGWKEYYFYNGGLYYADSPYGELPYDPAISTDTFSTSNSSQTNAGQYPSLMSGQLYCERTLISQGGNQPLTGYEVARTQTFYYGFSKTIYNRTIGSQLSLQQVVGVVPTLTVTYSSPSITTYADITEALTNNCATLNYSYTFYDYPNRYGPWTPTTVEENFLLWFSLSNPLNTALPLARLTYNYSLLDNNTTLNATYTQSFPGVIAYVQGELDTTNPYYAFVDYNLYNSQVQTMTWQLDNITPPSSFATPDTTWGDGWEVTSSQVTTWASLNNGTIWCPSSTYTWQGNLDGTPQTSQFDFPWLTPSTYSSTKVWVQGDSVNQVSSNGIVLSNTSSLGVPTFSIYDQQYFKNIATFTNAGLAGGVAFYTGFESFEDLTPWSLSETSQETLSLTFTPQSYTGNRSLSLDSNSNSVAYQLSYAPSGTTFDDSRNWVLTLTLFSTTAENAVTIQVSANGGEAFLSQTETLGNSWVTIYLSPLNFSTLSTITSIDVGISFSSGTILIDNISLMPTTESSFAMNSYDSVTNQLLSTASLDDREFNTRYLYDNLKRPLGVVRKGTQLNEVDIVKLTIPYYSRFGNEDSFNANDPNALITLSAGLNSSAGYYFDFRDGLNPWNEGTVNDRLLMLDSGTSASFTLPEDISYGYGIQVQIQGYIQDDSYSLDEGNTSLGLPAPIPAHPGAAWGCYTSNSDPTDIKMFTIFDQDLIQYPDSVLENMTIEISTNGQSLVSTMENICYGVLQDSNQVYGLYNVSLDGSSLIMQANSGTRLFPVSLVKNNLLYVSDENSLYTVLLNPSTPQYLCTPILPYNFGPCTTQPIAGGIENNQILVTLNKDGFDPWALILLVDTNRNVSDNQFFPVTLKDNVTLPLAIDALGNFYAVGTSNTLYAYDTNLSSLGQIILPETPVFQPVAGNGIVAVVLPGGQLNLYTSSLALIAEINVDDEITSAPIINGDKISVIGQNTQTNTYTIYTYNTAGLLVTAPYVSGATQSLVIASYSSGTSLTLMEDATTFTQISIGVPSATISMGSYTVSWDADNNQFSLSGSDISVDPVTVAGTQGNWLFVLVNPVLYFYADGQQIFAVTLDLDALPTGNFTLTAGDNALSCRDIILINDPYLQVTYRDGENMVRQVQQMADVVLPQQSN